MIKKKKKSLGVIPKLDFKGFYYWDDNEEQCTQAIIGAPLIDETTGEKYITFDNIIDIGDVDNRSNDKKAYFEFEVAEGQIDSSYYTIEQECYDSEHSVYTPALLYKKSESQNLIRIGISSINTSGFVEPLTFILKVQVKNHPKTKLNIKVVIQAV